MLSEGHMLGSCGKNPKCLNSAQKNSLSGASLLSGSENIFRLTGTDGAERDSGCGVRCCSLADQQARHQQHI